MNYAVSVCAASEIILRTLRIHAGPHAHAHAGTAAVTSRGTLYKPMSLSYTPGMTRLEAVITHSCHNILLFFDVADRIYVFIDQAFTRTAGMQVLVHRVGSTELRIRSTPTPIPFVNSPSR